MRMRCTRPQGLLCQPLSAQSMIGMSAAMYMHIAHRAPARHSYAHNTSTIRISSRIHPLVKLGHLGVPRLNTPACQAPGWCHLSMDTHRR
jgi:hypothetical protein